MDIDYIKEQIHNVRGNVIIALWNEYCMTDGDLFEYFETFDNEGISNIYGNDNLYEMVKGFVLSALDKSVNLDDEYFRLDNYSYPISYSVNDAVKSIDVDRLIEWISKQNDKWRVQFNKCHNCNIEFDREDF